MASWLVVMSRELLMCSLRSRKEESTLRTLSTQISKERGREDCSHSGHGQYVVVDFCYFYYLQRSSYLRGDGALNIYPFYFLDLQDIMCDHRNNLFAYSAVCLSSYITCFCGRRPVHFRVYSICIGSVISGTLATGIYLHNIRTYITSVLFVHLLVSLTAYNS